MSGTHPAGTPRLPAQVVIGLDVGTTSAKAVAFGMGSPWRHVSSREYPLLEPAPGWQVQDPQAVVAATEAALAQTVAASAGAEIVAVSLSTAMHGLIGLDEAMAPRTPLLTWADSRATDISQELRRSGVGAELHQITGTPVHPMTPLVKIMWMCRNDPDTWARVRWWAGLKDYLLWRLTGTLATETSSASGTGLMDRATGDWSPTAVQVSGAALDQLPPILPTTTVLRLSAAVARRLGLPAGTPLVVGAADGPLANLGVDAMEPGVAALSLGTSGAVRMIVPDPPRRLDPALFCYALAPGAWALGGAIANGGIVVRWAGAALAPDLSGPDGHASDDRLLQMAADVPPGSDGLVMLPYILAERAPLWDPDLAGAFLGLRRVHTRAHMVRAAVEGVALQLSTLVDRLDAVRPVTAVRATGGALQSELWRDVLAASLDRPLWVADAAEGSALGAAALGVHALGWAPRLADAPALLRDPHAPGPREVRPDPALAAVYANTRREVVRLIGDLAAVGRLFAEPASAPTT